MHIIYPSTNKDATSPHYGEATLAQITAAPKFLATLTGTEEEKLIHIANKDLPTGTPYEITDEDTSDRDFRNAWEYVAGASEQTSADLGAEDLAKYNMTENL
jgi:hypothetical protein